MKMKKKRAMFVRSKSRSKIGPRCPDYMMGCPICDIYEIKDRIGRFPYSWEEFDQLRLKED